MRGFFFAAAAAAAAFSASCFAALRSALLFVRGAMEGVAALLERGRVLGVGVGAGGGVSVVGVVGLGSAGGLGVRWPATEEDLAMA